MFSVLRIAIPSVLITCNPRTSCTRSAVLWQVPRILLEKVTWIIAEISRHLACLRWRVTHHARRFTGDRVIITTVIGIIIVILARIATTTAIWGRTTVM